LAFKNMVTVSVCFGKIGSVRMTCAKLVAIKPKSILKEIRKYFMKIGISVI